jgi:hypothetical protein
MCTSSNFAEQEAEAGCPDFAARRLEALAEALGPRRAALVTSEPAPMREALRPHHCPCERPLELRVVTGSIQSGERTCTRPNQSQVRHWPLKDERHDSSEPCRSLQPLQTLYFPLQQSRHACFLSPLGGCALHSSSQSLRLPQQTRKRPPLQNGAPWPHSSQTPPRWPGLSTLATLTSASAGDDGGRDGGGGEESHPMAAIIAPAKLTAATSPKV